MAEIDEATRRRIIEDGDEDALVQAAEKIGRALALTYRLTTSQIRGIFGTVRRIEMDWVAPNRQAERPDAVRRAQREFALLQPRIAYQSRRERGRGVQALSEELLPAMKLVGAAKGDAPVHYKRFRNFVDFFEAILAYHRAEGGSNN